MKFPHVRSGGLEANQLDLAPLDLDLFDGGLSYCSCLALARYVHSKVSED